MTQRVRTPLCDDCGTGLPDGVALGPWAPDLHVCPVCGDKRREREIIGAVNARIAAWALVRQQWVIDAGIPADYRQATLDAFRPDVGDGPWAGFETAQEWITAFDARHPEAARSVVLFGQRNGSGKTHLLTAMLHAVLWAYMPPIALIEQWEREDHDAPPEAYQRRMAARRVRTECPARFETAGELLMRFQAARRYQPGGETDWALFQRLASVPVLGLDDLGRVKNKWDAEEQHNFWFLLINARQGKGLPTLITSNLDPESPQFAAAIGEAAADRLQKCCTFVEMEIAGESYRTRQR